LARQVGILTNHPEQKVAALLTCGVRHVAICHDAGCDGRYGARDRALPRTSRAVRGASAGTRGLVSARRRPPWAASCAFDYSVLPLWREPPVARYLTMPNPPVLIA
jgi:hypothetical protein